jgi:hypothetical protein
MKNAIRLLLAILVCCCIVKPGRAQLYLGYRVGMYRAPEIPPQVYAAKFNAGWKFRLDGNVILFDATSGEYKIDNNLEWGNLPHGINLGFVVDGNDNLGMQFGFFQFSERSSGKRTHIATGTEETFSLKSKTGGVTFNVVYSVGRFKPFIGTDMGTFKLIYSFKNDEYDINKQKLGYNISIFGDKVGDRSLVARFNFGTFIEVAQFGNAALQLVPQYQMCIRGFEEINRLPYQDHIFDHSNFSLGLFLTYAKN